MKSLGTLILLATSGLFVGVGLSEPERKPAAPAKKVSAPAKPNYAEHIAPILNRHCVECHRPGAVAPFSLVKYEDAKRRAGMIAEVAESRQMPPWKAKAGYGEFHGENRLDEGQILALKRWAASGAPQGDPKKVPKPPVFSSSWKLGPPDLVLQPSKPFRLEAEGEDVYRNFPIKTNFKERMWVTAMDVQPGNAKVVHHVIAFLDDRGQSLRREAQTTDGQPGYETFGGPGFLPSGSLGGWAPGLSPFEVPKGKGFLLEPGATIVMQVHYHRTGKPETDQTKLGLYFSKVPVSQEMRLAWYVDLGLRIPAGAANHRVVVDRPIRRDITLYGVMPHMHLLGRSMKASITRPDGREVPLVHVDDWDFNWQLFYAFRQPIKVPAGSRIRIESVYDNSADNPLNPNNPPKTVTWGEETTDEMFLLIGAYTVDGETFDPSARRFNPLLQTP